MTVLRRLYAAVVAVATLVACSSAASTSSLAPATTTGTDAGQIRSTSTTVPSTTSTSFPEDAILVSPGTDLGRLASESPPGTTFVLEAGAHTAADDEAHVIPKEGQSFVGRPGAVMDGGGKTTFAFWDGGETVPGVRIEGLTIQDYANPPERGAIDGGSPGWSVVGTEIHSSTGAGIVLSGNDLTIEGNFIHDNSQIGIVVQDSSDSAIVGNEIAYNNPDDDFDPSWEAGGTKFLRTTDLYVAHNFVHDNHGPGLWTDYNNRGTVYERNRVVNNTGPGIFHEVSGHAAIRDNVVTGNAHGFYLAGILVVNSDHVEVTGNVVTDNNGGIVGLQEDREGPLLLNLTVTGNTISHTEGVTGIVIQGGPAITEARLLTFEDNEYEVSGSRPFRWGTQRLSLEDWMALENDEGQASTD